MAPATTPPTIAPGHHQPHQASALFDVANAVATTVAAATKAIKVFLMEFTSDQDAQHPGPPISRFTVTPTPLTPKIKALFRLRASAYMAIHSVGPQQAILELAAGLVHVIFRRSGRSGSGRQMVNKGVLMFPKILSAAAAAVMLSLFCIGGAGAAEGCGAGFHRGPGGGCLPNRGAPAVVVVPPVVVAPRVVVPAPVVCGPGMRWHPGRRRCVIL